MAENPKKTGSLPWGPLSDGLCLYKRHIENVVLLHWDGWKSLSTVFDPAHFCTLNIGKTSSVSVCCAETIKYELNE